MRRSTTREADAVIDAGGNAADAVLADDLDEPFVRIGPTGNPYHGTLESGVTMEDVDPAKPYEPRWTLTGADMPDVVARALLGAEAADGVASLATPAADGVAAVKPRRPRPRRAPPG